MLLAGCCLTLFGVPEVNALTLDEVQAQFAQSPVVQAQFTQQRSIKGISRPLISHGTMLMDQSQGIVWEQTKPFAMKTIITADKMVQVSRNKVQTITKEQHPQLFNFTQVLNALFTSNRKLLEQNFDYIFKEGETWHLTLTPKQTPLDKIFSSIELTGQDVILQVVLNDKQGDKTQIDFTNHKVSTQATPAQLQAFDPQANTL